MNVLSFVVLLFYLLFTLRSYRSLLSLDVKWMSWCLDSRAFVFLEKMDVFLGEDDL